MANWQAIVQEIPALRRYARSLLQDSDLADDLVQSTLEKAARKWSFFSAGKDLRPWLFKIMHNQFVDDYRRQKKATQFECRPGDNIVPVKADCGSVIGLDKSSENYLRIDLDRALQQLSNESRELFLMVTLEGFSYAQISDIFSIPQGTVMSRLSRIRSQLRKKLTDYGGESTGLSANPASAEHASEGLL